MALPFEDCPGTRPTSQSFSEGGTPDSSGQNPPKYQVVSVDECRIRVPSLAVSCFCERNRLSAEIRSWVEQEKFVTTAALFEVSDVALTAAGLKGGDIAEIKRALKDFLSEHGIEMPPRCKSN
ncbi:hypothetical protein B0H14DRAFT_3503027 [Mycena olivaceomarginata]|nr:hypothetical protein B0H14DRAFT_3503027 [Mycena olivaceomarginata]